MVDLNKTIWVRIEWFYSIIIIFAIVIIAISIISQPIQPQFIPYAVAGLATMSGVMTAFIGLWIIHIVPAEDELTKRIFSKQKKAIVFSVVIGIFVVIFGLNQLVYGMPEIGYNIVLAGTLIITCVLLVIMTMVVFFSD
jgi:hypothetical protein